MTDRRIPDEAPELHNAEQDDELEQAQTVAQEAGYKDAEASPLDSFILPGGSEIAARLHVARAAVRRAERAMTALAAAEPVNPAALAYVNRLSDYLFVLARDRNDGGRSDVKWVPGQNR